VSGPNINRPVFDELREHPGFNARRARLGSQLGSQLLGASLWEVDPGEAAYPFHVHLAEEELLVVQPDSGKVGAFERRPRGGGLRLWFNPSDAVDYYEGEAPPSRSA